ncbi:MAG: hypothetical protein DMD49_02590 [Gemmatimonadetes bacterium]|nr:MAG: hypothetical protein DMD49_02590 [Gemmatimonadota bacterium]
MKRGAITLLVLAIGCSRSAADHEELGDREYAKGSYRDALAEYQLGLKAHQTADLHAKTAAAALHTQDYALAAAEYRELADKDRSRAGEAAVGLERVVRAALAANERAALVAALRALQVVTPTRPLGRYARIAALDAADRGDTAGALGLLPSAVAAAPDGRSADSLLFLYGMAAARARDCATAVPVFEGVIRRQREPAVSDGAREGLSLCTLLEGSRPRRRPGSDGRPRPEHRRMSHVRRISGSATCGSPRVTSRARSRATSRRSRAGIRETASRCARSRRSTRWGRRMRPVSLRPSNCEGYACLVPDRRSLASGVRSRAAAHRDAGPRPQGGPVRSPCPVPAGRFQPRPHRLPPRPVRARSHTAGGGRSPVFHRGMRLPARGSGHGGARVPHFPDGEYAPLALLRAGDANLRLWRRPELDPEPGQTALATYQELQGRYPGTDAAARAQLHVSQINELFAEKNYKNGMFYFRRRAYDSAIIYFKDVIANYPGTRLVPDALLRLVDSYRAIRYIEELKEACANLRQYYPKTDGLAARCPAETGNPARSSGTP